MTYPVPPEARMIDRHEILDFARAVADEFQPERIILFGSYASGTPRLDSDVDLLIVMPFRGNGIRQSAVMLQRLSPGFAVDLVLRTPEDLRQRLEWNDFFLQDIVAHGTTLYEAPHVRTAGRIRSGSSLATIAHGGSLSAEGAI